MQSLQVRKEKYARNRAYDEGNILIDDKPKNIEKWIAKGGIGILYQANQDNLKELYNKVEKILWRIKYLTLPKLSYK